MNDARAIDEHDCLIRKINAAYLRLPNSAEKVQFARLSDALSTVYSRYSIARNEHRRRPSPERQALIDQIVSEYDRLREDVELSLTIATICL